MRMCGDFSDGYGRTAIVKLRGSSKNSLNSCELWSCGYGVLVGESERLSFCVHLAVIGIVMNEQSRRISRGDRPACLVTALFDIRAVWFRVAVVTVVGFL